MSIEEFNQNLNDLKDEDLIWLIYIFLAAVNIYSNHLERTDLLTGKNTKKLVHEINLTVIIIAFFTYLYFLFRSYRSIKNIKIAMNNQHSLALNLFFISALLFVIAGGINIFAEKMRGNSAETAFFL